MPPRVISINEVVTATATIAAPALPRPLPSVCPTAMSSVPSSPRRLDRCQPHLPGFRRCIHLRQRLRRWRHRVHRHRRRGPILLSIPEGEIRGALALKVRSGVTATPVNQAAARTITLVFKPV